MIEEFEEEIAKYGEKLDRKYSSPAAKWLFAVNPDTKALDTSKEDICRRFLAKLLWVMKRARPNTEPTMGFLSSRVKQLDKDDQYKLKCQMCWLKDTVEDARIIGADSLLKMIVMIDSAYAVHANMRG